MHGMIDRRSTHCHPTSRISLCSLCHSHGGMCRSDYALSVFNSSHTLPSDAHCSLASLPAVRSCNSPRPHRCAPCCTPFATRLDRYGVLQAHTVHCNAHTMHASQWSLAHFNTRALVGSPRRMQRVDCTQARTQSSFRCIILHFTVCRHFPLACTIVARDISNSCAFRWAPSVRSR